MLSDDSKANLSGHSTKTFNWLREKKQQKNQHIIKERSSSEACRWQHHEGLINTFKYQSVKFNLTLKASAKRRCVK